MASFDPSILSQIPDMAGNPVAARAGAYKLADIADQQQLRRLQLGGAQREEKDQEALRALAGKSDLSTQEGRLKFVGEAGKISPELGMKMLRESSQENLTELEAKKVQLDFMANELGPRAVALLDTLDTKGPAQAAAEYQRQVPEINARLKAMGMNQQLPPQMDFTNPQSRAVLQQQIAGSQTARQMVSEQYAKKRDERADATSRRQQTMLELAEGRAARQEKQQADKEAGVLSPDDLKFTAQQYLAGDKSVFQNIGRGAQGARNVVALRSAIREEAQAQGISPQDVATKLAEFTGLVSEERSLGQRQAAIETAATEAQQVIPIALKASEAVPRGKFVPVNKLIQAGKVATSDPNLARFAQANLTLANVYARAISPTGVPTVSGREHALEVLSTATSPEAYAGVVDIMKQEIEAARKSPTMVRQDIRGSIKGDYQAPAPAPAAGTKTEGNVVHWNDLK